MSRLLNTLRLFNWTASRFNEPLIDCVDLPDATIATLIKSSKLVVKVVSALVALADSKLTLVCKMVTAPDALVKLYQH
jgi:hypothetical protein